MAPPQFVNVDGEVYVKLSTVTDALAITAETADRETEPKHWFFGDTTPGPRVVATISRNLRGLFLEWAVTKPCPRAKLVES